MHWWHSGPKWSVGPVAGGPRYSRVAPVQSCGPRTEAGGSTVAVPYQCSATLRSATSGQIETAIGEIVPLYCDSGLYSVVM